MIQETLLTAARRWAAGPLVGVQLGAAGSRASLLALPVALAFALGSVDAAASSIVTLDRSAAATWQSGARILGFDTIPGAALFNPGTIVPRDSQLSDDYAECAGAVFSSAGGPAAVIKVLGSSQAGDAQTLPNIVGGTSLSGPNIVINYLTFIEIEFVDEQDGPRPASRVGAWNDPTGSRIRLSVFDSGNRLLESVEGNQGVFLGIAQSGIARARFEYVSTQTVQGFSLDDITIGRESSIADLNGDGDVDGADLGLLLTGWGECAVACCVGDLNVDGQIDGADLGLLLAAWTG